MTRFLGLDPGSVRCGVAITDSSATMAFPRPALANDDNLLASLRTLIEEELVGAVIVGRPVALSGNETSSTRDADALFRDLVEAFTEIPVIQWDERLTTYEAQRSLSQAGLKAKEHRDHVDSAAAVIMLQNYVDGHHAL
ncbi:MAG TPA: Holliday junction resolvase RuvX [Acidimicrobiales bacterium]|nr:Holliday junction resolvase RuvX [Acidimicrobiales bacterium]